LLLALFLSAFFQPLALVLFIVAMPFYAAILLLFSGISVIFILLMFGLAYFASCYSERKKKTIAGFVLFLVLLVAVSFAVLFLAEVYNDAFGRSCSKDSDCQCVCGQGGVNGNQIAIRDPFLMIDCWQMTASCKDGKCTCASASTR
ncbi:MAG: hypothetical protein V1493_04025, partial [Candidatus Diapherotrites archaeon]